MRKLYTMGALALATMVLHAKKGGDEGQPDPATPEVTETPAETPAVAAVEAKSTKSIVPSKYAGKYKDGGSDALAEFIKSQAVGKDGFEFSAFFELCRKNGIAEEKVAHYEKMVANKEHGAEGRARMTLRNMLATPARKNGKLIALDGSEVAINLPKPPVSGAAASAKENAGGTESAAA